MTKKLTQLPQKGFTIIEVVLVLAIAGLIFLIVFLALPQLQQSRRDTQRKNDLGRLMGALDSYAGNNSGSYPASLDDSNFEQYLPEEFNDPSGDPYELPASEEVDPDWTLAPASGLVLIPVANAGGGGGGGDSTPAGTLAYSRNAKCEGDHSVDATGAASIAAQMKLEKGQYCLDNNDND